MKLAIDCRFIGKSGIGTYIENIVDELLLHHPEHTYLLVAEKEYPRYANCRNVSYVLTDIQPFTLKELFCFSVKEINRCDVFFSPYINIPGGIRVPVYSTIHDVIFLDIPELSSVIGRLIRRGFYFRAIWLSKAVFTVSEFSKSRIQHHFSLKRKVVVTYCAISSYVKNAIGNVSKKEDYFIYIGNIKKHKGLVVLLKAFHAAKKDGLTSKLYIVGENDKFRTAEGEISQYIGASEDVCFTGFVDNNQLMKLLASAKALILPSFYEGLGLPPMEALYLGTEAIISDIQVFKEIYAGLPVTYFKVGDSEELKNVLLQFNEKPFDLEKVRNIVDAKYNFKYVTSKILNTIENDYTK